MKIAIDAMGGDNAPQEIVAGACDALRADASIEKMLLVGDQEKIEALVDASLKDRIEIVHCDEVIGMDEHPAQPIARKRMRPSASPPVWSRKDGQTPSFLLAAPGRNL